MTVELKSFRLEVKDVDEGAGEFTGYAAVFGNRDSYGDVIERGAFAKTIRDNNGRFPVLWQHDPGEPIGVSTEMEEDAKGLLVRAKVSLETRRGREALSLMRMQAVRGLSIGFEAVQRHFDAGIRRITEIKLWEFSPVTFPANELALVTGVKGQRAVEAAARWAEAERKIGKVLSASNRALVESAIEALQALLDAADPPSTEGGEEARGAATQAREPAALATPGAIASYVFGGSL